MKTTTREQLEDCAATMAAIIDKADKAGRDLTPAESKQISALTSKSHSIRAQYEIAATNRLSDATGTRGRGFDDGGDAVGSAGPPSIENGPAGAGARPALRFAENDLRARQRIIHSVREASPLVRAVQTARLVPSRALTALHSAVAERYVATKMAISTTQAPQADTPVFDGKDWPGLRELVRISDAIPFTPFEGGTTVHGFKSTTLANAAATVAPGALKPESAPAWTEFTSPVRKIAHWTEVHDEVIADYAQFFQLVGAEMVAGLVFEENAQVLTGDGVGTNLLGIVPAATAAGSTIGSLGTDLDAIVEAMTRIRTTAFVEPTHLVMHPNDWGSAGFVLAKDTEGRYLLGDAVTAPRPMLWGMQVWLTTQMTENSALVANFERAAMGWVREAPRLDVAPASGTEFKSNTTLIRAEERIAVELVRPEAVCVVTAV